MTEPIRAVIYACLSKKGEDAESIPSQIKEVRKRLTDVYADDLEIIGEPFTDDGESGSKKNRGPGLETAVAAAVAAAEEHGSAELWANTSARFARGTGKKDEARSLLELFTAMTRAGVVLRTVQDDYLMREELVGINSRMAAKYSEDLSESVKRSKRRQAERGQHLGGPLPLGYTKLDRSAAIAEANPTAAARPAGQDIVIDPKTAPTVERIHELGQQGVPDGLLARTVNKEGHRSRSGRPFDRRSVQAILLNPIYAGLIVHDGEEFETHEDHPRLVDRDAWRRMVAARDDRDLGSGSHKAGAPARRHLLSRLAECGRCGGPMFASTASYRRKSDGGRSRSYRCRSYANSDGVCAAKPVDAELVDTAVLERLHDLLPDFELWISQIDDRHADERKRIASLVDKAAQDRDAQARATEQHKRRYRQAVADDDDAKADALLGFVEEARSELEQADLRLTATRDALASVPAHAPRDRLLDFAIDLRDSIRGKTTGAHSVEDVNRALVETFDSFVIWDDRLPRIPDFDCDPTKPSLPDDEGVHAGAIKIDPSLRPEVVQALLGEGGRFAPWPDPPLEWIEALQAGSVGGQRRSEAQGGPAANRSDHNSGHSQAYLSMKPKRRWLAASQGYAIEGPRSSSVAQRCKLVPGGATHFGLGLAFHSTCCSASERKPELTDR